MEAIYRRWKGWCTTVQERTAVRVAEVTEEEEAVDRRHSNNSLREPNECERRSNIINCAL